MWNSKVWKLGNKLAKDLLHWSWKGAHRNRWTWGMGWAGGIEGVGGHRGGVWGERRGGGLRRGTELGRVWNAFLLQLLCQTYIDYDRSRGRLGLGEGLSGCWVVKLKQDFKLGSGERFEYSWLHCILSTTHAMGLMIVLVLVMMTMTLTMKGWR